MDISSLAGLRQHLKLLLLTDYTIDGMLVLAHALESREEGDSF